MRYFNFLYGESELQINSPLDFTDNCFKATSLKSKVENQKHLNVTKKRRGKNASYSYGNSVLEKCLKSQKDKKSKGQVCM